MGLSLLGSSSAVLCRKLESLKEIISKRVVLCFFGGELLTMALDSQLKRIEPGREIWDSVRSETMGRDRRFFKKTEELSILLLKFWRQRRWKRDKGQADCKQ